MRPLTLHVSALSDAEYGLYTTSLDDLASDPSTAHSRDDAYYEQTAVGVREARAWLRGRYPDLPASDIDAVLRLFCPAMSPSDTLTGGQFFAAFRLVIHARAGKAIDRTLAFVQASPNVAKAADVPRSVSPPKRPVQAPPSHPDRQKAPPLVTPHAETNPFTRKVTEHAVTSVPTPGPAATSTLPQQHFRKLSLNPFLARDKHDTGIDKAVIQPASAPNHGKLPPLPPRKPSLLAAPPRRPSEAVPTPITSTTNPTIPFGPPLVPTKPTHVMSPLMRQSLEASKHAQSMKRAEEQLDRERVLQVLKTTSSSSSTGNAAPGIRTRSLSPSKQLTKPLNGHGLDAASAVSDDATYIPPLPRRRKPSLPSSPSSSVLSLEQVASAKLPSPISAPSGPRLPTWNKHTVSISTIHTGDSGPPLAAGPGPIPPPRHPRRRPSTSTEPTVNDLQSSPPSSPRVARSKSVAASSSIPPPPPRRRRPESMQLTPTSDMGDFPIFPPVHTQTQPHSRTASFQGLSRHLSLSRDREREPSDMSPIANIQRTLSHLQLKAQPRLDAVRYKAEAGISRRGYVHHTQLGPTRWREEGEQGLMADAPWAAANVDRDPDSAPTTDDEPSSGDDQGQKTTPAAMNTNPYRDLLTESDNLKWPVGEGWKPL